MRLEELEHARGKKRYVATNIIILAIIKYYKDNTKNGGNVMDSDGWEWRGYFRLGNLGRTFERLKNIKDPAKQRLRGSFTNGRNTKDKGPKEGRT